MRPVASRDKDVESRLALYKIGFFREPQATRSVARGSLGCRLEGFREGNLESGPGAGELIFAVAEFEFDDVHPGVAPIGGYFYALVKVRIPLEIIEHTELPVADVVNLTCDRVRPAQAYRWIILELVHRVIFFSAVLTQVFGAMHKMIVALTAF